MAKIYHKTGTLDSLSQANLNMGKSGNGALAPVLFQQGKIGELVQYCIQDVYLTKNLFELALSKGELYIPKLEKTVPVKFV